MMIDNYLDLKGVSMSFPGGFKLNNIEMSLPKGYIMGFAGHNGAGKTTTIQLILNMLEKEAGEILVFGKDNIKHENAIKQDIGVVFDNIFYVENWTVSDTEKAVSIFYNNWKHDVFDEMTKRFDLPGNKKVKDLSRGMQIKLMLACAFSHDAKLLILDEPTSGLDPLTRDEFSEIMQEYIKDGERSVLFSTHITTDLERIADYITIIQQGNMVYTGSMEDLLNSYRFIKGKLRALTAGLENNIIGLRKTDMGFEGLIGTKVAAQYKDCVIEAATIDNIIISISKGGAKA
jgi:ABC-2 type transport system ATP-binding protein